MACKDGSIYTQLSTIKRKIQREQHDYVGSGGTAKIAFGAGDNSTASGGAASILCGIRNKGSMLENATAEYK